MKNYKNILLAIVFIGLVFIVVRNWNKVAPVTTGTTGDVRELCYIWNTEAGDSATLRLAIDPAQKVVGSFNWMPAEKDSKKGPFVGTAGPVDPKAMARTADLIWTATGEGVTNKEELKVMFGEGVAIVGAGEMKLRESDGVYVYADPTKISYGFNLQQTDCSDPAVK